MLFQTYEFLILIAVVMAGVASIRHNGWQHALLTTASYVFYGWWDVRFLMLIVLSTMIDYAAGLGIQGVKLSWRRRAGMGGICLASVAMFLGINWPAIQGEGASDLSALLNGPQWTGGLAAIGICVAFSVIGPFLYELYFRLGEQGRRKAFVVTSLVTNLGMLAFFKYFNFFTENLVGFGTALGFEVSAPVLSVALPVGISFYTFQTLSYTIDAYRGHIQAERSFLRMALYVAYFPQLVAGPILRPQHFLPALDRAWSIRADHLRSGVHLIAIGLFKKVLIADNVSPLADVILNAPEGQPSIVIILGVALFAIQIYCDFSGYTDIARGVSRMFGVEIPLNFNFPYFSTSIIDFWRRWHISLSSWLRDYLYIPLGGSKVNSQSRLYFNLMATMVLGGLWHGASWNFVIWGAYQGGLLCINRLLRAALAKNAGATAFLESRFGTVLRWAVTLYFWLLGWLIFRVTNLEDLLYCMKKYVLLDGNFSIASLGLGRGQPVTAFIASVAFIAIHSVGWFSKRWGDRLDATPALIRAMIYTLLAVLFFYGWPTGASAFIYFQF